jgi:hypothetical protein
MGLCAQAPLAWTGAATEWCGNDEVSEPILP